MEELYEILGLDPDEAPTAKVVQKVKTLQEKLEDKNQIIQGLQGKLEDFEEKFDSLADGVAEARVKDLVQQVQHETGYHVGSDNMEKLQNKAARHLYAGDGEKEEIYEDMKAYCLAYGSKVGMDDKIKSLQGGRSEEEDGQSKEFRQAKQLVESGEADDWDEAYQMVQQGKVNLNEE